MIIFLPTYSQQSRKGTELVRNMYIQLNPHCINTLVLTPYAADSGGCSLHIIHGIRLNLCISSGRFNGPVCHRKLKPGQSFFIRLPQLEIISG